jgi:hypothetical protein
MAHAEQTGFIRLIRNLVFPSSGSVLEIGSYQLNESVSLRSIFSGCSYTGVDLIEGPGVDVVASGHEVDLASDSFDVTLSAECRAQPVLVRDVLQHVSDDKTWWNFDHNMRIDWSNRARDRQER